MPCWKPPRWSLGASALVAVVVAGCGASSTPHKPSLHATAEKRLLSLVARARVDAKAHNGTAVHAVLGEFVSEIQTLKTSGQLTDTTAANLDHEASTTATQAVEQLHPAKPADTKPAATAQTTLAAATTAPNSLTTAATAPNHPTAQVNSTPSSAEDTPQQNDQSTGSRWPGHGHGYGHRYGAGASGWRTALRNWVDSQSGGDGGND